MEVLGEAVLELTADLAPLNRALAEAERRVATAVAAMQAMLDRDLGSLSARLGTLGGTIQTALTLPTTHAAAAAQSLSRVLKDVETSQRAQIASAEQLLALRRKELDMRASALGVQAPERLPSKQAVIEAMPIAAPSAAEAERQRTLGLSSVSGVRGKRDPGSIQNPQAVVIESAQRFGLGSMAAAIGEQAAKPTTQQPERAVAEGLSPAERDLLLTALRSGSRVQQAAIMRQMVREGHAEEGVSILTTARGGRSEGPIIPLAGGGGEDGKGRLRRILWGAGWGGLAGVGTAGALAGLGPDRLLFSGLGLLGSAAGAAAGGGLMAAGAAGQFAVGAGSNLAVMRSTIADTNLLAKGYEKLEHAVKLYGAGSNQAVKAQKELNVAMAELGGGVGVQAEARLAKQKVALNTFWDEQTQQARVAAVHILEQVLSLAHDYVPRVARAAQENLTLVNQGIKPLFAWLKGPEGVMIWNDLERRFRENIPHAVHAFTQAVELLLKTVDTASQYTGGFTAKLDAFFTKWNSPQFFAKWHTEIGRLIEDFRLWGRFFHLLGQDIFGLFSNDAHLGNAIIQTVNGMLLKLREWERSTQGSERLKTIFQVHKEEVVALLHLIPLIVSPLAQIYLTITPPLVKAFTGIVEVIAKLVKGIEELGPAVTTALGGGLLLHHFGLLGSTVGGVAGAFGLMNKNAAAAAVTGLPAESAAAERAALANRDLGRSLALAGGGGVMMTGASRLSATERANAARNAELAAAERTGLLSKIAGATGLSSLASGLRSANLSELGIRAGAAGFGGYLVGNIAKEVTGAKGTLGTALETALTGAAIGSVIPGLGTAVGALAGGAVGAAAPFIAKGLESIFATHSQDYGKRFADGFVRSFGPVLGPAFAKEAGGAIDTAISHAVDARKKLEKPPAKHESVLEQLGIPLGVDLFGGPKKMDPKQVWLDEWKAGLKIAEKLRSVQEAIAAQGHASVSAFTRIDVRKLMEVPAGEIRFEAAQAMIDFAKTLEAEGKLPKGAMRRVIHSLEAEFPHLTQYLAEHGYEVDRKLAPALALKQSEAALRNSLKNMVANFGVLLANPEATGHKLAEEWRSAMRQLAQMVRENVPGAKEALETLGKAGSHSFYLLERSSYLAAKKTKDDLHSIESAVASFAKQLPKLGEPGFKHYEALVTNMLHTISTGVGLTTAEISKGIATINKALEGELKELGAPKEIRTALVTGQTGVNLRESPFKATGGLVQFGEPGAHGQDSIPVTMGGVNIIVGPGEVGAVLTADQQAYLNRRLAPEGGLPGFFEQVNRPHYMAAGGFTGYSLPLPRAAMMPGRWSIDKGVDIPAPAGTPEFAIGPGVVVGEGISGFGANAPILEINSGPLRGRKVYYGHAGHDLVPVGAHVRAGEQISSVGAGIVGISTGPHIEIGFGPPFGRGNAMAAVLSALLSGAGVAGGTTATGVRHLHDLAVHGYSAGASLIRAALGTITHAANRYLDVHAPAGAIGPAGVTGSASGRMVPGIMGIEQQAAHIAGLRWNPAIISMLLSKESSGGINEPASGPLRATGPNQVIPSTFAAYALAGHRNINNPLDNAIASMRYVKSRYGSLEAMAAATGLYGSGYKGYARGGLVRTPYVPPPAFAFHQEPRASKARGVRHVPRTHKAGRESLGKLITNLSQIPGFSALGKEIGPAEGTFNLLADELSLLSNMQSNPASILPVDMRYLAPTLLPGEHISPYDLVTHAERELQRSGQGKEATSASTLQGALLSQISGLDDHRLLSEPDIGVLRKDFSSTAAGVPIEGVEFHAHDPVFAAQLAILQGQLHWQEALVRAESGQKDKVVAFLKLRKKRKEALEKLLAVAYARHRNIKRHVEELKAHGLRRRLSVALAKRINEEQRKDASSHLLAIQGALAIERSLPTVEQNQPLMRHLVGEEGRVRAFEAHLHVPSSAAVHAAEEAIASNRLHRELGQIGEQMQLLGGSSSHAGHGGEIGAIDKQIATLTKGRDELGGKIEASSLSVIPQLKLSISQISTSLAEAAEAVRPVAEPTAATAAGTPQQTELAALLKQQNEGLRMQAAVAEAQFKVLDRFLRLPPFGGHFAGGGVVPGMTGEPRLIIAHGGETVLPGSSNPHVSLHFADPAMAWLRDFVRVEISSHERPTAKAATRPLPGRGGGLLVS